MGRRSLQINPLENFMQSVTLEGAEFESLFLSEHEPRPRGGPCWGAWAPLWAPHQAETSLLLVVARNLIFYVLHSDEAQWEASGSVLMTLVPTHLHPKAVSSAFCCRDSLWRRDMGGRALAGMRPRLISERHRSVYRDILQNNTSCFCGTGPSP